MTGATLQDVLVALRRKARLSQDELADVSGVNRGTVKNIEKGRQAAPKPKTLASLSRGLATDGDGQVHDDAAETYYQQLMSAAGYLPAEVVPSAVSVGLQAEIEALGFRPDESPLVSEIVQTIAEDTEDERLETIEALRSILKLRARRQVGTVR